MQTITFSVKVQKFDKHILEGIYRPDRDYNDFVPYDGWMNAIYHMPIITHMLKPDVPIVVYSMVRSNKVGTFIFQSDVYSYVRTKDDEYVLLDTVMDRIVKLETVKISMVYWSELKHFDVVEMKDDGNDSQKQIGTVVRKLNMNNVK